MKNAIALAAISIKKASVQRLTSIFFVRHTKSNILRALAAAITGIAAKNENFAAVSRGIPSIRAPSMVAPDREVPGIIDNAWKQPIANDVLREMCSMVKLSEAEAFENFSTKMNSIPYMISADATV